MNYSFVHLPTLFPRKRRGMALRFAGLLTYSCLLAFPPYYIYRQWRE
jgi:hypothetical protein